MIYKLDNGGTVKLQKAGSVPEYGNIEQIAKYNREHGTHFWKMSQVLEHDKQQAQQKTQDKKKSFWEIFVGHPESVGEAILNKTIETANNTKLPETRKKIYNDTAKQLAGTTATSLGTVALLALSGGAAGPVVADIVNTGFGAHGLYNLASGNGIQKTVRLANQGDTWGAVKSGAGDLLDLSMGLPAVKLWGNLGKSMLAGQSLGNAYRGNIAGREMSNLVRSFNVSKNPFYSDPIVVSTIDHLYKEHPELAEIGPKEAYSQYYKTIFPASKVQIPYAHGTRGDLSKGLEGSTKISYTAAPETIGRNDFYLNLQPEASLQYADGVGVPEGFTWNKHRFWPLKEILGKPYKSDSWMFEPIQLRKQIPNRAGQFSRVKNIDGTYSGHGKLLEEYKAELGMQDLSDKEFLQRFGIKDGETFEQWVAENKQKFSDIYNSGNYQGLYHVKVDASNPLTINGGDTYYSERGIWDTMNAGKNDVLLHNNAANEFGSDVMVVKDVDPSKVRILGSDPDKHAFANFMNGHNIPFTPIQQKPVSTIHFDPRVKPMSRPISETEIKGQVKQFRNQKRGQISGDEYSGLPKGERNNGRYGNIRFIRHMDVVPEITEDGFVQIAPKENFFANFTTDQLMVPHARYDISQIGKNVIIIDPEAFRGTIPLSLDPSDSFFLNQKLKIKPKHVTFISGDKEALQLAKERGFNIESSPKLKILSRFINPASMDEQWAMKPALEKKGYWSFGHREFFKLRSDYVDELRRILDTRFPRPSIDDYRRLETVTNVPTHVYPNIRGGVPEYVYFYGPKKGYKQVIYDTTSPIEGAITKSLHLYPHPTDISEEPFRLGSLIRINNWLPIKKQGGILKAQEGTFENFWNTLTK